jgi:hypothetical protein
MVLDTGAFVHYAVTAEDGALMKGSVIRPDTRWLGNPATEGVTT